jgi:hypothetical protein
MLIRLFSLGLILGNFAFAITLEQFINQHLVSVEINGGTCTATLSGNKIISARHCLEELPAASIVISPKITSFKITNLKTNKSTKLRDVSYSPILKNDTATFSYLGEPLSSVIPSLAYPKELSVGQKIVTVSQSNFSQKYIKENSEKFYKLNYVLKSTTELEDYIVDLNQIESMNENVTYRTTFATSSFRGLEIIDPSAYLYSFVSSSQFDLYSNPNYYPSEFSKENFKIKMDYEIHSGDSGSPVLLLDSENNVLGIIAVVSQDIHFSETPDLLQTLIFSKVVP